MSSKRLETAIKVLICATFFVPLIVLPSSYIFPFIVPKIVWFRSLTLLMLGAYILLLIINWKEYRPKFTPVTIAVLLFFLSFVVSTFVGVDWYRSFWDNHERMLGLFTIIHYVIYYFIVTAVIREWSDWKWLLRVFLFAGCLVMFIGFLQKYVNSELLLNRGGDRVSATLGNPIYFSGYGLFLMFIGYLLAIKETNKKNNLWFWYAVGGCLLGLWGIFGGGTRGALLGLLAGLGVLVISYAINFKENKKIQRALMVLVGFGCLFLGLMFLFRQTNFVKNIPTFGRLVNISFSSDTADTRLMAWGIALDAWKEKPVFGWGPNNYYYAFNRYYRPQFLEAGWGETWFDNAHSVIMNTFAVQGGVGILTYLGIYIIAIFLLWRGYKKGNIDAHIVSVGSAFLIAHLVSLATVFENPTSYLYFFFFLAFVSQFTANSSQPIEKKNKESSVSGGLTVFVGLVMILLIYTTDINVARANQATLGAIRILYSNSTQAIDSYKIATAIPSPHIDDIRNDFSRTAIEQIVQFIQNKQPQKALELFSVAYDELHKNLFLHPSDIRVHLQLAQLDVIGVQLKQDQNLLFEAEKLFEEALQKSPKRQQIQYALAALKMQLRKIPEAIKLLQDGVQNDPKIGEGWWRLAMTYYQSGDLVKAKETINQALEKGVVFDSQGQQIVSMVMATTTKK